MSETRTVRLGDYCQKIEKITSKNFSDESFQYVDLSSIDNKKKIITKASKILTIEAPSRAKQILKKGDILVSTVRPNLNAVAVVPDELDGCIGSTGFSVLRPTDELDPVYLFSWVCSPTFVNSMVNLATGASYPAISDRVVKDSLIPFPPLEEQKRIAAEFTLTRLISQKRERQQALFEELSISYYEHHFSQRENFNWIKLGDITSKIGSGATPKGGSQAYKAEGIALIRSMNVHDRRFVYEGLAFIDDDQAAALSNVEVQENDVLLNITGASVARVCRVPADVLPARVNQHVAIIRLKPGTIEPELLERYLTLPSVKKQLLKIATSGGATREAITKKQIQEFITPAIIHHV